MNQELRSFSHRLEQRALHIDYLRIRCGRERTFEQRIMQAHKGAGAHIAFSEWDVVLFVPSTQLYPPNLTAIYSDRVIADTIAGCTGYFNYLWEHDINEDWESRLLEPEPTIALLVSLRFTDRFRSMFGIGAELLFCNFLYRTLGHGELAGIKAVVAHSVGWNDATVILKAESPHEKRLVDALTAIRYATERQVVPDSTIDAGVIAATYSHVIGNLRAYRDQKLTFGSFRKAVKAARLLIRVNPDMEVGMRKTLGDLVRQHHGGVDVIGSELGHYNFSADISGAFQSSEDDPVQIIQGFRVAIREYMEQHERRDEMSFPETTTEITFKEPKVEKRRVGRDKATAGPSSSPSMASLYSTMIQDFLNKELKSLDDRASPMTRHRLAILLVTVLTYLDDPVRGSVVGHLCRFLRANLKEALTRSDRASKDDLCNVLEYALHQATDGLNQFQHDANSLGLSGRGGYNRLIQAVEEFIHQITRHFDKHLTPLITFGLRPSGDDSILNYWLDVPFSTAFNTERWHIVLHDLARLCWLKTFEWRLESYDVWQEASRSVFPLPPQPRAKHESRRTQREQEEQRRLVLLGRDVLGEVFPSYALLHLVASSKLEVLDDLMISREFMTTSHPLLIDKVVSQVVLHVLLDLHEHASAVPLSAQRRQARSRGRHASFVKAAFDWWERWVDLSDAFRDSTELDRRLSAAVTQATSSLSRSLILAKRRFRERDVAGTLTATAQLVKTQTFGESARRNVKGIIDLLALLGKGYVKRHRQSFEAFDPSVVAFGQMLKAIQQMRETARVSKNEMEAYRRSIEDGTVFALAPQASSVASFLAATENHSENRAYERLMIGSLSSILSLWHGAVTGLRGTQAVALLRRLERLGIVNER
ncbi:MAG TPA: hypothetical protein VHW00_06460 [Thermoanaerobaculia bacterium]|nr:hypothetical protein [Thermoanaerobaculia bacterium]